MSARLDLVDDGRRLDGAVTAAGRKRAGHDFPHALFFDGSGYDIVLLRQNRNEERKQKCVTTLAVSPSPR
jgi:hypothetical protein